MAALEDMEVGAADSDAAHTDQHFVQSAGAPSRFEGQFPGLVAYHCLHNGSACRSASAANRLSGAGLSPFLHVVEVDHQRDQQALKHHFPEWIDVEQNRGVAHRGEQHRADDSPQHGAPTAE